MAYEKTTDELERAWETFDLDTVPTTVPEKIATRAGHTPSYLVKIC